MSGRPHEPGDWDSALARGAGVLERALWLLLAILAVAVLAGGAFLIVRMDAGARSQGGRLYVAVAAVILLGALDTQAARLAERRWRAPGLLGESPAYRRFVALSALFLVLAAALLLGLALLLP